MLVGIDLAAAATAHTSPDAAARFLMTAFNSGAGHLFTYVYFVTEYAAPILMGFALWRSRRVPLWLAALFAAGFELASAQSSKGPIVIAWMLPWGIAMVLLAVRIWQAAASRPPPRVAARRPGTRRHQLAPLSPRATKPDQELTCDPHFRTPPAGVPGVG